MVSFPSCSTVCPAGFLPKFSVKWRKFSLEAEPRGEILGTKTENEGWKPAGQTVEHDGKQTKPLSEKDQVRKVQIVKAFTTLQQYITYNLLPQICRQDTHLDRNYLINS